MSCVWCLEGEWSKWYGGWNITSQNHIKKGKRKDQDMRGTFFI